MTFAAQENTTEDGIEERQANTRARTAGAYSKKINSNAFYPSEDAAFAEATAPPQRSETTLTAYQNNNIFG